MLLTMLLLTITRYMLETFEIESINNVVIQLQLLYICRQLELYFFPFLLISGVTKVWHGRAASNHRLCSPYHQEKNMYEDLYF
jgi:hypothetical protein